MASLNTMVKRCSALVDTTDLTDWENRFMGNVIRQTNDGDNTSTLTEKQVESLERIYEKHFEG